MIDNFDAIKTFMDGRSRPYNTDLFYRIEVKRLKYDNPSENTEWRGRSIVTFCVANSKDLMNYKNRIVELCNRMSARAYIRVNRASYIDVALGTMKKILQCFPMSAEGARSAWDHCSLTINSEDKEDRCWVLHLDTKHPMFKSKENDLIAEFIHQTKTQAPKHSIIVLKDTGGVQILHTPFRMNEASPVIQKLKSEGRLVKDSNALLYHAG